MGQPLRIEPIGGWFHVFARAAWGRDLYLDDSDRSSFVRRLSTIVKRHGWRCTGYCLMSNHYHLLLQLTRPTLAAGMQDLNSIHARRFNSRHGRRGHLFSERYEPVLMQTEAHVLWAHRYVARNPVEAGLCSAPAEWRWSSHRAVAGFGLCPSFLCTGHVLALFGGRRNARARYRAFVEAPDDPASLSGTR